MQDQVRPSADREGEEAGGVEDQPLVVAEVINGRQQRQWMANAPPLPSAAGSSIRVESFFVIHDHANLSVMTKCRVSECV